MAKFDQHGSPLLILAAEEAGIKWALYRADLDFQLEVSHEE